MKRFLCVAIPVALIAIAGGCARAPKSITPITPVGSVEARRGFFGGTVGSEMPRVSKSWPGALRSSSPREWSDFAADEVWVIYRPQRIVHAAADEEFPHSGALMTRLEEREVPLPLKHTDVHATVNAIVASVTVEQQFHNPFDRKIEAVYVFPLPENSAVNEFIMTIGERRIRGIIRERAEAEQIYRDARQQGYAVSLMTQERPNIFTQSVANIDPGREIDVTIKYFNTLAYADGWYEFVFPMVVGPRFNPLWSANGIGAVPRSGLANSGQGTDIHYLAPGERSGHDISLELTVNPGVPIEDMECKTHSVLMARPHARDGGWEPLHESHPGAESVTIRLDPNDSVPNKDFVFRYRVAGREVKSSFVASEDERGGFFTMMIYPPAFLEALERAPVELVFVLDCSGSMEGAPIRQAKDAIGWALRHMDERDTFQIIKFADSAEHFSGRSLPATPSNVEAGLRYLNRAQSGGGTMMLSAIDSALFARTDRQRVRFVCFLTDGFIGNEAEILAAIQRNLGDSRIFSFGVGTSVNRYLLESMAKVGRGAVAYLNLQDNGEEVMQNFFDRISHPAMTNLKIDWGNLQVSDLYPKHLPDLFVGRAVTVCGQYRAGADELGPIQLSGRTWNGSEVRVRVPVSLRSSVGTGLPSVWARMRIAELTERARFEPSTLLTRQMRKTALDFLLLSPYTAFVALDASRITRGHAGTTIPVAVPVPEGVRYETTVPE